MKMARTMRDVSAVHAFEVLYSTDYPARLHAVTNDRAQHGEFTAIVDSFDIDARLTYLA